MTADYVNISGFTVEGATGLFTAEISLDKVYNCTIANNTCTSNYLAGIYIRSSANNKLSGNGMRACVRACV